MTETRPVLYLTILDLQVGILQGALVSARLGVCLGGLA